MQIGGIEVLEEDVPWYLTGRKMQDRDEWLRRLCEVTGIDHFSILDGETIKREVRNERAYAAFDLTPYLGRKLFTDDKRDLARSLGLVNSARQPRG